jgi:hypothetical protein
MEVATLPPYWSKKAVWATLTNEQKEVARVKRRFWQQRGYTKDVARKAYKLTKFKQSGTVENRLAYNAYKRAYYHKRKLDPQYLLDHTEYCRNWRLKRKLKRLEKTVQRLFVDSHERVPL